MRSHFPVKRANGRNMKCPGKPTVYHWIILSTNYTDIHDITDGYQLAGLASSNLPKKYQ